MNTEAFDEEPSPGRGKKKRERKNRALVYVPPPMVCPCNQQKKKKKEGEDVSKKKKKKRRGGRQGESHRVSPEKWFCPFFPMGRREREGGGGEIEPRRGA